MTTLRLLPKLLAPLVLLPLTMLSACSPQVREYGGGGAGGSSSSSSGGMPCGADADCGASSECQSFVCTNGTCNVSFAPMDTAVGLQEVGDCKKKVCNGKGYLIDVEEPADTADDGNPCTLDTCVAGQTQHDYIAAGTSCNGSQVCDGSGFCVECLDSSQCTSGVCASNTCAAPECSDMILNGSETDIDCGGGQCPGCSVGYGCVIGKDCKSQVCNGGKCDAPTCADGVPNGLETYIDCGGPDCPPCKAGVSCNVGLDCMSGICTANVCAEATCDDMVTNGGESDLDCGGPLCAACPLGRACNSAADCQSNDCCVSDPPNPGYCKMPGTPCQLVVRSEATQ